jgi:hypothetical protein
MVPTTGIYRIIHAVHRLPHEVILVAGGQFPRCSKCDVWVSFELVREVRARFEYEPVQLYELPVIDDEENKADSAQAKG